jgi:hypothetical protein
MDTQMRKNNNNQEDQLTLDDLFQLKRQEKPVSEFWDEFDAQLQQKMLGSLVDRRTPISRAWQFTVRKLLPLSLAGSAVAALVVSMTPLWKSVDSTSPSKGMVEVVVSPAETLIPEVVLASTIDFHQVDISATEVASLGSREFSGMEITATSAVNEIYETNPLIASIEANTGNSVEKLF